jgi:hypothetical protein
MSNRAWLHLALEGRLKLRRSGLASRSTHVVIPHPSSEHQSSSILSTCSRRLPRLENIWECLVGHISKLSKHVGFLRTKTGAKPWLQNAGTKPLQEQVSPHKNMQNTKCTKNHKAQRFMASHDFRHVETSWNAVESLASN